MGKANFCVEIVIGRLEYFVPLHDPHRVNFARAPFAQYAPGAIVMLGARAQFHARNIIACVASAVGGCAKWGGGVRSCVGAECGRDVWWLGGRAE